MVEIHLLKYDYHRKFFSNQKGNQSVTTAQQNKKPREYTRDIAAHW